MKKADSIGVHIAAAMLSSRCAVENRRDARDARLRGDALDVAFFEHLQAVDEGEAAGHAFRALELAYDAGGASAVREANR